MGYSPWGHKELDMTDHTHARAHTHTHTHDLKQRSVVLRSLAHFLKPCDNSFD